MRTGQLMRRCQQPRSATIATPATLVAATPKGQSQPKCLVFLLIFSVFACFTALAITTPRVLFTE